MDNYKPLIETAQKATVQPPATAWDKLENRLEHKANMAKDTRRRTSRYLLSIIAISSIVLASMFIYTETKKNTELSIGNIASWEELDVKSNEHFASAKVQNLNSAYQNAGLYLLERTPW